MGQNATHTVRVPQDRHSYNSPFRRLVGSWMFTPLVLALVLSVVFAIFGYGMQKRESEELHAVFEQHLVLVTRVLEVASEHALRDGHQRDLHRIITSVETHDDELEVLIADAGGHTLFSSAERAGGARNVDAPEIASLISQTLAQRKSVSGELGAGVERQRVVTALLDDKTMPDAVLVVQQSMRTLELDLLATRTHAIQVTLVMAIISLIFGLAFAHVRVREPLRALRAMMDGFKDLEGGVARGNTLEVDALEGTIADRAQEASSAGSSGGAAEVGSAGASGGAAKTRNLNDSLVTQPARWTKNYRTDNEVRAVTNAFEDLIGRLTRARQAVDVLHAQREALVHRLGESTGRAKLLQFASELAHEIGSPLQVILGRAAMLDARADDPDAVRRHAQIVVDETHRMHRVIAQSLQETEGASAALSNIDVVARVREIAALHSERTDGRDVPYFFDLPEAPLCVRMDSDTIDQILRNVLANAHEACLERGEVYVELHALEGGARLHIRDTGVGMNEETLKNALQPFFSTRKEAAGHGLGLPIVQRLCRDFGVDFDIESHENEGTRVTLTFSNERSTIMRAYHDV